MGSHYFIKGQDFLPFLNDNRAGINQVLLQPASIADGRLVVDFNIVGLSAQIRNDYVKFESGATWNLMRDFDDPDWLANNAMLADPNGKAKNATFNFQVVLPSFMFAIDRKQSIGFVSRIRDIKISDNVDEPLARSIFSDFEDDYSWQQMSNGSPWHAGRNISGVHHTFADYGIVYAREIFDKGDHYLKGGATIKFLQGISSTYIWIDELTYWFEKDPGTVDPNDENSFDADSASWNSPLIRYGTSENWQSNEGSYPWPAFDAYTLTSDPSVGLDIGVVYEWRPDSEKYTYDMNGKKGLKRKDLNKYKIKVGVSVLDIGSLKYKKINDENHRAFDFSARFTPGYPGQRPTAGNTSWMLLDPIDMNSPPYYDFADTVFNRSLTSSVTRLEDFGGEYRMKLPTALSFQFDWNIDNDLYLNLTSFTSLVKSKAGSPATHYVSNYSITPRYEGKWFGAAIPVQYNEYEQFLVGLGLRLGFIWIGTNDLLSLIGATEGYGSSIHFAVKVPIHYKAPPSDIDGDGISDARDKCPTVPGVLDFDGCPDKDMDGVPDNQDLCPDDPGLKEFDGCPDRDGDGIIDKLDDCPSDPGLEEYNGCPDTDRDGIIDRDDRCPNTPGIQAFFGCPDTDEDGIPDNEDLCPTEPGLRENQGCPKNDADGDGIVDAEDACPEQAGPVENRGCPYVDTDNDGVLDKDDRCPLTPGDPANFGCPEIQEPDLEIINAAFKNLEFETSKAVILSGSYSSLNELANLLERKPEWKLKITGHTDSSGNDEYNMQLSEKRAKSVADYFVGQGISRDRLIVEWYGETRPIADNSTPSGRAQNRRVEMEIVFD